MFWYIINNTYFCVKYKDMKEKISQILKLSGLIIVVFFFLLVATHGSEHEQKMKDKIEMYLRDGWITSVDKELPEDYSPKKYKYRYTKIENIIVLQYKLNK
jgi:hypothetical protein